MVSLALSNNCRNCVLSFKFTPLAQTSAIVQYHHLSLSMSKFKLPSFSFFTIWGRIFPSNFFATPPPPHLTRIFRIIVSILVFALVTLYPVFGRLSQIVGTRKGYFCWSKSSTKWTINFVCHHKSLTWMVDLSAYSFSKQTIGSSFSTSQLCFF